MWIWNCFCFDLHSCRTISCSQILQNGWINIVVHWKFWKKYQSVSYSFSCNLYRLEEGPNLSNFTQETGVNISINSIISTGINVHTDRLTMVGFNKFYPKIMRHFSLLNQWVRIQIYSKKYLYVLLQCMFSIFPAGAHQLKWKHTFIEKFRPVFFY